MRILAIERECPKAPAVTTEEVLRVEAACVWDLQRRGIIRDIWFTTSGNHAVIMLECTNATEARQHLAVLPLVHAGVIDFTVHELRSYDGFERLFAHRLRPGLEESRERAKKPRSSKAVRSSRARKGNAAEPNGNDGGTRTHSSPAFIKS
jgi:muconolactone delta-isomerase